MVIIPLFMQRRTFREFRIKTNKPVPPKSLSQRLDPVVDFVTMFAGIWFGLAFTALAFAGEPALLVPAVCFGVAGFLPMLGVRQ